MKNTNQDNNKKYIFGFMDETGLLHTPQTDRLFALGILKLHHPRHLHKAVVDFKNKKRFHKEFHFTNVNDKNWRLYQEFVDLFFNVSGCIFSSMVFDKNLLNIYKFFKGDCVHAYNSYVAKLIAENLDKGEYISIISDDVSTPKTDNFEKQIKTKVKRKLGRNALFGIIRVESHAISELQIVDVLLGIVGYAFKIKYKMISKPNKSKLKLVKELQKKIGVTLLSTQFKKKIKGGGSFEVKEFSP